MSSFSKHGTQRVLDAAAKVAVERYMQRDSAEKLEMLRESLKAGKEAKEKPASH